MSQGLTSASGILASGVPLPKNSAAQSCEGTCRPFDIHHKSEVHTFSLLTAYLLHPPFDYASLPGSMPQRSVLRRVVFRARLHRPLKTGLMPQSEAPDESKAHSRHRIGGVRLLLEGMAFEVPRWC